MLFEYSIDNLCMVNQCLLFLLINKGTKHIKIIQVIITKFLEPKYSGKVSLFLNELSNFNLEVAFA